MANLSIKLRDGFNDDTVTIKVDGKQIYQKSGVTTDLTISFADTVEVPVEKATVKVEVAVAGGAAASTEVTVAATPFVDVWGSADNLELRPSAEEVPLL